MSSAYIQKKLLACEKSFLHMINNTGPKSEPCRTPIVIGTIYFFNINILFSVLKVTFEQL